MKSMELAKILVYLFFFVMVESSSNQSHFYNTYPYTPVDKALLYCQLELAVFESTIDCLLSAQNHDLIVLREQSDLGFNCLKCSLQPGDPLRLHLGELSYARLTKLSWYDNPDFVWSGDCSTNGGVPYSGITGEGAISFNGLDGGVNLGNLDDRCFVNVDLCTNGVTYSFWSKMPNERGLGFTQQYNNLILGGAQQTESIGFAYFAYDDKEKFWISSSTNTYQVEFNLILIQWHHVIATFHQSEGLQLYIDGLLVSSGKAVARAPPTQSYDQLLLGEGEFILDDFRVYNRFLDAEDAKQLFLHSYSVI